VGAGGDEGAGEDGKGGNGAGEGKPNGVMGGLGEGASGGGTSGGGPVGGGENSIEQNPPLMQSCGDSVPRTMPPLQPSISHEASERAASSPPEGTTSSVA